ncbi:MAG: hypothetical protein IT307_12300 [Chloroflexi bacterium]|nr:hypothetical protein [Chloroflexota bacterium]
MVGTRTSWRFGTVLCMHCGGVAATIFDGLLELAPNTAAAPSVRGLRCPRCKGPTYVERELEPSMLPEMLLGR